MSNEDGTEVHKNIQLRFIDSCRFMVSSLDKLASNLDDDQCKHLKGFYKEDDVFRLMRRKSVCAYGYMDSSKKFEETKLPPENAFYSRLNMTGISDQDYEHAQQVCDTMEKKTLGYYYNTYSKTDVLLLTDVVFVCCINIVFETCQNKYFEHYKLDPAHFYTAPGLAWQAF